MGIFHLFRNLLTRYTKVVIASAKICIIKYRKVVCNYGR